MGDHCGYFWINRRDRFSSESLAFNAQIGILETNNKDETNAKNQTGIINDSKGTNTWHEAIKPDRPSS